ncbi:MAG: hypothetical protein FJ261_02100 [Planctomycetes bacterium]|nr:hypothetical protein [Planctomycetota bacterium]
MSTAGLRRRNLPMPTNLARTGPSWPTPSSSRSPPRATRPTRSSPTRPWRRPSASNPRFSRSHPTPRRRSPSWRSRP